MKELDHSAVLRLQKGYPAGTRILLLHMQEEPRPIPANTKGTVEHVDDIGQLHCRFDNGHSHALIPGVDEFRKLMREEMGDKE